MRKEVGNVAAIAIAKDEAAYLPEWIHHQLYFGFSPIFIALNRTVDASCEVIKKIQEKYDQVYFVEMDWIDWVKSSGEDFNPEMQNLSYAYLVDFIRRSHCDVTHVMLIDVDEYWFPVNFKDSIVTWIKRLPYFDILSFYWLCQQGDKEAFEVPFVNRTGGVTGQIKSVINLGSPHRIKQIRPHCPLLDSHADIIHVDECGKPFSPKQGQRAKPYPGYKHEAYILHRMQRSEEEYLSLLASSRFKSDVPIKHNRDGFVVQEESFEVMPPSEELLQYHQSLRQFVEQCELLEVLEDSRITVRQRAKAILNLDRKRLFENLGTYIKALRGTKAYHKLMDILDCLSDLSSPEINSIRDCAVAFEGDDLSISYELMQKARNARPHGPFIAKKVEEYRAILRAA